MDFLWEPGQSSEKGRGQCRQWAEMLDHPSRRGRQPAISSHGAISLWLKQKKACFWKYRPMHICVGTSRCPFLADITLLSGMRSEEWLSNQSVLPGLDTLVQYAHRPSICCYSEGHGTCPWNSLDFGIGHRGLGFNPGSTTTSSETLDTC